MTGLEGGLEAKFQFVLQLFIVFNRSDRKPTLIQMLTLASSLVSIAYAKVEYLFARKPSESMSTKMSFFPYGLSTAIAQCGSLALMAATIQWNVIFVYIFGFIVSAIIWQIDSTSSLLISKNISQMDKFMEYEVN